MILCVDWCYRLNVCVPSKIHVLQPQPSVVLVLGSGEFGRWLGYKGRGFMNGISTLGKQTLVSSLAPSTMWRHNKKAAECDPGSGSYLTPNFDLGLTSPQNCCVSLDIISMTHFSFLKGLGQAFCKILRFLICLFLHDATSFVFLSPVFPIHIIGRFRGLVIFILTVLTRIYHS